MACKQNLDLRCVLISDPGTLGAGAKTRLESRMKKFTPHCVCRSNISRSSKKTANSSRARASHLQRYTYARTNVTLHQQHPLPMDWRTARPPACRAATRAPLTWRLLTVLSHRNWCTTSKPTWRRVRGSRANSLTQFVPSTTSSPLKMTLRGVRQPADSRSSYLRTFDNSSLEDFAQGR